MTQPQTQNVATQQMPPSNIRSMVMGWFLPQSQQNDVNDGPCRPQFYQPHLSTLEQTAATKTVYIKNTSLSLNGKVKCLMKYTLC